MAPPLTVVYPVRVGHDPATGYEELRWSLRSVDEMVPDANVVIVGGKPAWLSGEATHVPTRTSGTPWQRSTHNLREVFNSTLLPDASVLLMMDDVFILRPHLPMLHGGPFDAWLTRIERTCGRSSYTQGGRETLRMLRSFGHAEPLSWSLHVPLMVHRGHMRKALRMIEGKPGHLHLRTVYGAIADLEGVRHGDVKFRGLTGEEKQWAHLPYVSSSDRTWAQGALGHWVRARFPDPCRFERSA